MEVNEEGDQVRVDYEGSEYVFETVDEELRLAGRGDSTDTVPPDEVVEELETRGYIVSS